MIVRIRKCFGVSGGANYYYHADIICKNKKEAMASAKKGLVHNWRWIDTFDTCFASYVKFVMLGSIEEYQAINPEKPFNISKRRLCEN